MLEHFLVNRPLGFVVAGPAGFAALNLGSGASRQHPVAYSIDQALVAQLRSRKNVDGLSVFEEYLEAEWMVPLEGRQLQKHRPTEVKLVPLMDARAQALLKKAAFVDASSASPSVPGRPQQPNPPSSLVVGHDITPQSIAAAAAPVSAPADEFPAPKRGK